MAKERIFDIENPSRSIVLSGEIEEDSVKEVMQFILDVNDYDHERSLEDEDYERIPIDLIINSGGGDIYSGFGLISTIDTSYTPIHTYCFGCCMSMALLIHVSGHKRYAHKLSSFMYHELSVAIPTEKLYVIKHEITEMKRLAKMYDDYLIEKTNISKKLLTSAKKKGKDWFISSHDALRYGIIDEMI